MAEKSDPEKVPFVIECPLAAWPGRITLPDPNFFDGLMWQKWRRAVADTEVDEVNRLYAYAGLKLIDGVGEWAFAISIKTVMGWEKRPADERIKFVSWIGREVRRYVDRQLLDPTE